MGEIKAVKGRFVFKHGTTEDWEKSNYIPVKGEKVVYDSYKEGKRYARVKYGDGKNKVSVLPFADEWVEQKIDKNSYDIENIKQEIEFLETEGYPQSVNERIENLGIRVVNLEKHIKQDYYETDDSIAYSKLVPLNACPYAGISKLGGRTDKIAAGTELYNGKSSLEANGEQTYEVIFEQENDYPVILYAVTNFSSYHPDGVGDGGVIFIAVSADGSEQYISPSQLPIVLYSLSKLIWINDGRAYGTVTNISIMLDANIYEHSKVTKVQSRGKNLLPSDVLDVNSWENYNTTWWKYDLDLPDGWYCVSAKLKEPYSNKMYLYIAKRGVDGKYTATKAVYGQVGSTYDGYLITDGGVLTAPFWFKVDKEAGTIYRFQFSAATQAKLNQIEYIQIEAVELAQEPSTSYQPSKYAPASAYEPYNPNPISTFVIPSEITALNGYGESNPDNADEYNYIDFEREKFVAVGGFDNNGYWVSYDKPVETNLSKYTSLREFIEVVGRGHLEFFSEKKQAVPSKITYLLKQ